jgi:uncharacterized membrane protein
MTQDKAQHNGGSDAPASAYNVLSVSFDSDTNAYGALSKLQELDSQGRLNVEAAAVVERGDDGKAVIKDRAGDVEFAGTATGGLIGLLIGVLGGPLGVLIGGTYGLMVGSLVDLGEAEDSESVLGQISASVRPGHTALLAQVTEQSPEVVDSAMARLGGSVLRRPVEDVEAEVAAADKAQRHAKREAARELRRARRERDKEHAQATIEQLKAKLGHQDKTAAGS